MVHAAADFTILVWSRSPKLQRRFPVVDPQAERELVAVADDSQPQAGNTATEPCQVSRYRDPSAETPGETTAPRHVISKSGRRLQADERSLDAQMLEMVPDLGRKRVERPHITTQDMGTRLEIPGQCQFFR